MPALSRFYGIVIKMYFLQADHNPPHIHAIYGDDAAAVDIRTGELLDGFLPTRASRLVREWLALHQDELLEIWETGEYAKIDPLD